MTEKIISLLLQNTDEKYRLFQCALMPTVNPDTVLGVRTPILRKMAKEYKNNYNINSFLHTLPHKYYEENNLHAFIIKQTNEFEECVLQIDSFLPYVNNWATCDSLRPKCFKSNKNELMHYVQKWIKSQQIYTVRYAIGMLLTYYLDEDFSPSHLQAVAQIQSEEYYVNMMKAWYFATALAKQYNDTIPYIENRLLTDFVHKKTIQKAIESYRISDDKKQYLKQLK